MAKLILSLDGMVIREYPLTKERTTLGRKPHNDIVIDNLAISGEHAMIMTILNDSFLEDLGSTNGTLVNGQPIKKHFLQNNDVVELGKYKLQVRDRSHAQRSRPGGLREDHGAARASRRSPSLNRPRPRRCARCRQELRRYGGQRRSHAEPGAGLREAARQAAAAGEPAAATRCSCCPLLFPSPAASARAQRRPDADCRCRRRLPVAAAATTTTTGTAPFGRGQIQGTIQILSGPSAGKELPLSKALTTLRQARGASRRHRQAAAGLFHHARGGATFPVVNGKQLDAQAHALNDHDVVELAGVKMEFYLKPAS